jgi:hypothetical protein
VAGVIEDGAVSMPMRVAQVEVDAEHDEEFLQAGPSDAEAAAGEEARDEERPHRLDLLQAVRSGEARRGGKLCSRGVRM